MVKHAPNVWTTSSLTKTYHRTAVHHGYRQETFRIKHLLLFRRAQGDCAAIRMHQICSATRAAASPRSSCKWQRVTSVHPTRTAPTLASASVQPPQTLPVRCTVPPQGGIINSTEPHVGARSAPHVFQPTASALQPHLWATAAPLLWDLAWCAAGGCRASALGGYQADRTGSFL